MGKVEGENPLLVERGIDLGRVDDELVPEDRPLQDGSVGTRDQELRGVDKDDEPAGFPRSCLDDGVVARVAEHAPGRANEEVGPAIAQFLDQRTPAPIGADHHADLAKRRNEDRGLASRGVPGDLVPQVLLAVLPDQHPVRPQEDGGVVACLSAVFQHAGDQEDIELVRKAG